MKRVLIIAFHFPPAGTGGVGRALAWVRHLPNLGWLPTVLAARPHPNWPHDDSLVDQVGSGVRVERVRAWDPRPDVLRGIEHRELTFLWYPAAYRAGRRILRDTPHDAILATAPPPAAHTVASRLSQAFALPWIADFRDPWGVRAPGLWRRLRRRRAMRNAARVVGVNETLCAHLREDLHCGVDLIPNGFEPDEIPADVERVPRRAVFLGTLSPFNRFGGLYRALAECDGEFMHVGATRDYDLDRQARQAGLNRVYSTGYLPRARALRSAASGSVFLLSLRDDLELALSTKTFDYIGLGGPVLCLGTSGAMAEFVRDEGLGECVAPGDVPAIRAALERLWSPGSRQAADLQERFTRHVGAVKMADLLEQATSRE